MTTTMAAHQEPIHERLQPEEPLFLHHGTTWEPSDNQEDHSTDMSPYYNMPKRNKRKNFKPRCAPNATNFSDDSNGANCEEPPSPLNGNERTTPDQEDSEGNYKIGVKNFSLLKGGAVDLSRRLSTDSNENDTNYQNRLPDDKKVDSFQRSYLNSLQISQEAERDRTVLNFSSLQNKNFCAKNPFAISQLIKTNSPPRRRDSESDDDKRQDINANERVESQEPSEVESQDNQENQPNGDASNATNRILRDYAMNTMKELLGIYGLSSNEVADAINGQIRALEALQGKPMTQLPLSLKRRHDSGDGPGSIRRSSSATEDEGSTNITPPKTPDNDIEASRQRALQILNQQTMRLFGRSQGQEEEGSGSDDGEQTLDLSVSRDGDGQEQSTTSSAGNSVSEFEQQSMLMRKNLEDLANLQMQGFFQKQSPMDAEDSQERKLQTSGLLSALNHLDHARKNSLNTTVDYSRYVKRYSSTLECGSSYCKDLGYREHFHCMDCTARVFCKKEEMIRHFKWHKKRDESLAHGFMRYSPLDDCSERFSDCPHNRSQTHYHCIQDGCDKVYISTSDVQMHANYHRKDSAILQEGFQRFRATESCAAPHCVFAGQRTTHFHCRRPGCTYTFKNKADMEKHKTYHIKDEALSKDGFKKYMKNEACPYRDCRFSRTCNHIHCIRPHCNYVLHSSSQIFTHKRKHERKEQEMTFGLPTSVIQSALLQQGADLSIYSPGSNMHDDDLSNSMLDGDYPHPYNPALVEEVSRKYIETFNGGQEAEDKCVKCSAFNKHYHCLAECCKMAHSCHNTMVKHVMEHEQQNQVTEAYFVTYTRHNPCSNSACQHIRDITHYHCTWENCGAVILSSEEHPFRRLEHHRQHAILSPMSPNLAARFAPNFTPQLSAQLHPNITAQLGQVPTLANLPPNLAQLAQMTPNLSSPLTPNLQAQLNLGPSPGVVPQQVNPSSSLDEMFSRKRGRPPKNRVVEVWTDNITPQAIFTSFKLPKSNQLPPVVPSPVIATIEEFPRIKFQHFEVYTTPDSCVQSYPNCQLRMTRLHLHCFNCSFSSETHVIMETHMRESHNVSPLLEGFDYFGSFDQCGGKSCFKNQLRAHFHCAQGNNCPAILTQYSALATHKHGRGTPVIKSEEQEKMYEEAKDYSLKERASADSVSSAKEPNESYTPTNFSIKSEFEREQDNVSVKATGTFYPSSHLRSNTSSPRSIYDASPSKDMKLRMDFDQKKFEMPKSSGPTIPPSCHDQNCPLNKNAGGMNLHYHCPHCSQAYVDLKLLFSHMVKKHSNQEQGPVGLAATKETLEREYPEISILPSTASASATSQVPSPSQRPPNPAEQVQAVQSLLLQQYLAGGRKGSLQDQLKMQQQYTASLAGLPGLAQVALFSQGGSPFPLYPMMYPPELLLEQSLLQGHGLPPGLDKEAELIAKTRRTHSTRGPHMRVLKDEPIPEGYLRFRFNEDCAYQHCGYREHQTHFHCTRKDCGYSFCDKTRFVQHTARHERLDTLMGGDFQQYRANVYCQRPDCPHASTFGRCTGQNKASHFHCLKCDFVCTDTNKVVAHRRQHQKLDSIQAAGFEKFPPSKGCGYEPQCIHSKKQTHYHCLQCGFAVLGLSQMTSHKYKHQEANLGPSTSATN
ncbi:zinc finger protein castor homolog 1-like isoform X3 [Pectinophora gossypiella]|uniref:zinc finger protein castor homolog 1-like isoform X3 n=1 Tax=Pectinophora gossypiella TaxID=13191 RepID=UPI00214F12AA|nr:zinc finger protein castor homolog 1-like isoform X3 [Pectinophora gossypiella]